MVIKKADAVFDHINRLCQKYLDGGKSLLHSPLAQLPGVECWAPCFKAAAEDIGPGGSRLRRVISSTSDIPRETLWS